MSVLDVACGPGYVSAAVRTLGAIPTGIDFSEKMVATEKKMFPDISFLQGDAQALPFDDASYDRVLVNFGAAGKSVSGGFPCIEADRKVWFHRVGRTTALSV
jgi:ubiquinone/menaquinone biosynthesis C-methylase UbiE